MEESTPTTRTIEVDKQVFDVLARTAQSRDTDINGVLKYPLEAPAVTAAPSPDDEDDEDDAEE